MSYILKEIVKAPNGDKIVRVRRMIDSKVMSEKYEDLEGNEYEFKECLQTR